MSREIIINLTLSGSIQFQVYSICLQQNGQDRTDLHTTKNNYIGIGIMEFTVNIHKSKGLLKINILRANFVHLSKTQGF